MHTHLQPGTLLDERYRIDEVLGQGGFGITYAAENTRIGMKVAVKELFWRGHSVRMEGASPEVALENADDAPIFEEQKQRFLREARTIRDFSGQPGVVGIQDYFEANGTAYIVMEYVQGETLAALSAANPLSCEDLLRRFLPIIDTLAAIHQTGVIHRDISPENIMVQPDGSLKLIDFGAARQYLDEGSHYTAISRDSYSPGEQYDRNGRQGPWTDVYALCATIYACVCGSPPPGAVQRLFLDELKSPSELGVDILPAYESILMKGLQLRPEKRWQDMDALARAIREALPAEEPPSRSRRGLLIGLLAGLLCAALAAGLWGWHRYNVTHKFRGIETEQLRFEATRDTTAAEFAAAQAELRKRLEDFAGADNYIMEVEGDSIRVTLPLSCFENREIPIVVIERFSDLIPGKDMNWWYDFKGVWEDPARSVIAGQGQVLPEALNGPTVEYLYRWTGTELTKGQRANLIVDFKTRLDALDTPYAFGTAYGNEDVIAYRIGLDRAGPFIENTLPSSYPLEIGNETGSIITISKYDRLETVEADDGAFELRFSAQVDSDIRKLESFTRAMQESGFDTLCLMDGEDNVIARTEVTEPVTDGALAFRTLCLEGVGDRNRWLANYIDALLYQSDLPVTLQLSGWEYIDANGTPHLDSEAPDYGLQYQAPPDHSEAFRQRLREIRQDFGYECLEGESNFWLLMDLKTDDTLPDEIQSRLPELVERLGLTREIIPKMLIVCFMDETNRQGLRFSISPDFNYDYQNDSGRFRNCWDLFYMDSDLEPVYDSVHDWFVSYDWNSLGLEEWFS